MYLRTNASSLQRNDTHKNAGKIHSERIRMNVIAF